MKIVVNVKLLYGTRFKVDVGANDYTNRTHVRTLIFKRDGAGVLSSHHSVYIRQGHAPSIIRHENILILYSASTFRITFTHPVNHN